jgi:hypothetical protein
VTELSPFNGQSIGERWGGCCGTSMMSIADFMPVLHYWPSQDYLHSMTEMKRLRKQRTVHYNAI